MRKKYKVKLKASDKKKLIELISKGREQARKLTRCRILLLSHEGKKNMEISKALSINLNTVRNICVRYVEKGLESA